MYSSFMSYSLLLCGLTAASGVDGVVKREGPLPNRPPPSYLSTSEGNGRASIRGAFDISTSLGSDGYNGGLGSGGFNGGNEFVENSVRPISNDLLLTINSATSASSSKPSSPSQGYGVTYHPSPLPPQEYGAPFQSQGTSHTQRDTPTIPSNSYVAPNEPSRTSQGCEALNRPSPKFGVPVPHPTAYPIPPQLHGTSPPSNGPPRRSSTQHHTSARPSHSYGSLNKSSKPSQGYETTSQPSPTYAASTPLPAINSNLLSSYAAPPASAGSGPYIGSISTSYSGNGGRYSRGESSWGSLYDGRSSGRINDGFSAPLNSYETPSEE